MHESLRYAIWGIGKASTTKLAEFGVINAAQLAALDPSRARRLLTVVGGRLVFELQGVSCLPLELLAPTRKGIAVTRSFGQPVTSWQEMSEALTTYATRAGEKLRQHQVVTRHLTAFMHTNCFNQEPWYANAAHGTFTMATNDTLQLAEMAVQLGKQIWRDGYQYAKAGVLLTELQRETPEQLPLLPGVDTERRSKLWRTVDQVNRDFGRESVRLLGSGLHRKWKVRADHRSPRWTTNWNEIPRVKA
ncbi:MAG: DUF4113 domain-containing protein [Acidobacteriaceae bacterium]|nr:DUF4113 domain-containing protein [Acidobacteriaceae bacterium]